MIENAIKKSGVFIALMMAAVLSYALLVTPSYATAPSGAQGGTVTFNKYMVMDQKASVPDATYNFNIEAGPAHEATENTPAVLDGIMTPGLNPAAVTFGPADQTYTEADGDDIITLGTNQKYAKHTVTVDLSQIYFPAPGIYRYTITESGGIPAVTNDPNNKRYLDVYVVNNANGGLSVAENGYVLHPADDIITEGSYGSKDDGFKQEYTTHDLTVGKEITGNQGDKNKYFHFTVTIGNTTAGTVFAVSGADVGNITYKGQTVTNPSSVTVDPDATSVNIDLYLNDGDRVIIGGLIAANTFLVEEDEEDYTPSYVLDEGTSVTGSVMPNAVAMQIIDGEVVGNFMNHQIVFTNDRQGTVPTGILLNIAPYAIVFMLSGAAIVLVLARKRKTSVR